MTPAGVVTGGWEYVTAAYVITALVLAVYAASVVARFRAEARRAAREGGAPEVSS